MKPNKPCVHASNPCTAASGRRPIPAPKFATRNAVAQTRNTRRNPSFPFIPCVGIRRMTATTPYKPVASRNDRVAVMTRTIRTSLDQSGSGPDDVRYLEEPASSSFDLPQNNGMRDFLPCHPIHAGGHKPRLVYRTL